MSEEKKKKEENQQDEDIQKDLDEILSKLDESAGEGGESKKPSSQETPPEEKPAAEPSGEGDFVKAEDLLSPESLMASDESGEEQEAFTTEVTVEGVAVVEELNLVERIIQVFVNPTKLFQYLKQKPDFWAPLILTILISMISGYYIAPIAINEQIQRIESNTNIPDDAKMRMIDNLEAAKSGTRRMVSTVVPPLISVPLFFLIIAFVFWATGNFVFARQVRFAQVFSAITYSNLIPLLLGTAIKLPLILATHSISVQTSPAVVLSADQRGTFLYSLLSSFDIFNLWYLAVFAIGMAVLYEVKRSRAYTLVFGLWFVWVLAKSAFSAFVMKKLGSMGMGA